MQSDCLPTLCRHLPFLHVHDHLLSGTIALCQTLAAVSIYDLQILHMENQLVSSQVRIWFENVVKSSTF